MMFAGIILCGGKSSRMGYPKPMLPFGEELMLQRVARLLREAVDALVVVAAPGQELPQLPESVTVVRDQREGRGPLEGLAAGIAALPAGCEAAYVTTCDAPFLSAAFVRRMRDLLGEHTIAVPRVDGYHHPLAAVYRPTVRDTIARLLSEDRLRPFFLFEQCDTREVNADELRDVDPDLSTLDNLNHPDDYLAALARAGFIAPADLVAKLNSGS